MASPWRKSSRRCESSWLRPLMKRGPPSGNINNRCRSWRQRYATCSLVVRVASHASRVVVTSEQLSKAKKALRGMEDDAERLADLNFEREVYAAASRAAVAVPQLRHLTPVPRMSANHCASGWPRPHHVPAYVPSLVALQPSLFDAHTSSVASCRRLSRSPRAWRTSCTLSTKLSWSAG